MKKLLCLFSIFIITYNLPAQDFSLYKKEILIKDKDTLRYRILFPEDYISTKKYPVITFLHGSGERGSDNESQLLHGGSLFLKDSLRQTYKAIVIFPQCPKDIRWNTIISTPDSTNITGRSVKFSLSPKPTKPAFLVKLLLDSLIRNNIADANQMYIGGLSLGGFGTFDMIERYPKFFAAAFPICGGGDTTVAGSFAKNTAVWIFHGDSDRSVDVRYSREYYATLMRLGADVRYTEYPGVGHNSWDNAFAEKDLLPWLFSKRNKYRGMK